MEYNGLSFSGGAMKGIAYCGVLKWLEKKRIIPQIKHISGTSIGALFGLLIVLNYTYKEVRDIIMNLDIYQLEDICLATIFEDYGLATGKKIEKLLKSLIKRKGYDENITFKTLYELTGKRLSFMTCKLGDCTEAVFDYLSRPDFQVYKACKVSMAIPVIWKSNKIDGEYYIDGCFIRNLPIHIHEDTTKTLGFYLITPSEHNDVSDFENYLYQIQACILKKGQILELENCKVKGHNIIKIEGNISINATKAKKQEFIDIGYKACEKFELKSNL